MNYIHAKIRNVSILILYNDKGDQLLNQMVAFVFCKMCEKESLCGLQILDILSVIIGK